MNRWILCRNLMMASAAIALLHWGCSEGDSGMSSGGMSAMEMAEDGTANTGGSAGLSQAGAQDFGLFRQILEDGGLPAPETLDDLGFFAEHKIDYPEADCGQDVCMHGLLGVMGNMITGSNCTLVQIGLNTPIDVSTLERPPLHLVLAVDVSGSMDGEAIEFVKEGMIRMLDELEEGDRISLVTYSTEAKVVLENVSVDEKMELETTFSELYASGYTNLYDGMFTAFELAAQYQDVAWQNRVILLSDGVATAGIQSTAKMTSLAESYARLGIGITTIGLGDEFDIEVMRDLAEVGAGNFYFLEDAEAVKEVFTEEVETFLYPVAVDVQIALEVGEGYILGQVYGTNGWVGDSTGGIIDIPSLFIAGRTDSEEPIEDGRRGGGGAIIVELLPLGGDDLEDPYNVMQLTIDWTHPVEQTALNEVFPVDNPQLPGVLQDEGFFTDTNVEKGFVMLNIFVAFQMASELVMDNDLPAARVILEALRPAVAGWLADNPDPDLEDDLVYVDLFIDNLLTAEENLNINTPPPPEPQEPWGWD